MNSLKETYEKINNNPLTSVIIAGMIAFSCFYFGMQIGIGITESTDYADGVKDGIKYTEKAYDIVFKFHNLTAKLEVEDTSVPRYNCFKDMKNWDGDRTARLWDIPEKENCYFDGWEMKEGLRERLYE